MTQPSEMSWLEEPDFERTVIGQKADALLEHAFGLRLKTPIAELPLQLNPILIGRDATCTLQLPSRMVSRHHAVIYKAGKHHVVRDLHSTNGVLLNGVRVTRAVIRAGDNLLMGDQKLSLTKGLPSSQQYSSACVVLFLDLENSTSLAERYGDAFSKDMQAQMQLLEDQVLIHLGTPVKLLGDGLMCAFGLWPVEAKDYHAVDQAMRFAWQAVKQFRQLEGYEPMRLRVGLHWGPVVVAERSELDLFGDTVNTAARLEDANKHFGTQILVSSEVRERTRLAPCLREVDTIRVQGKDEAVNVYTWDETFVETRSDTHRAAYAKALDLYRSGQFPEAVPLLEQGEAENDNLSVRLKQRILSVGMQPPPNFDGAWSLKKAK
ncbi:MAG: adenylate/guanylate cyclase domain-containing protein [Candidatus Sericytochromatia bacterium]